MSRSYRTFLAVHATAVALPLFLASPALAQQQSTIAGAAGVPGTTPAVAGELTLRETGPLTREFELSYEDAATGKQVTDYEVELTQQLHILAIDEQLQELVHEHVREVGPDGRFATTLTFHHPGTYHIYTDAAPAGLGQQVMRFDAAIDIAASGDQPRAEDASGTDVRAGAISSSAGAYTVRLDATRMRAGQESVMALSIEKDGQPATDLAPYLGVAAHVVLIRAEDLAYVHAHGSAADNAMPAGAMDHSHDMANKEPGMDHSAEHAMPGHAVDHDGGHHSHDKAAATDTGAIIGAPGTVPAKLSVYVTPPAPGTYGLWIEFAGGGDVITVPFRIDVPAT